MSICCSFILCTPPLSTTVWNQGPLKLDCCKCNIPPAFWFFRWHGKSKLLYPFPEQVRQEEFTEKWMYAKLQSNVKFINWIQDHYMNPNQLLSLGRGWLLLPYVLLALGFAEWQWEHYTEVLYSNHHLSLNFPFTNHVFISCVAAPRVQEHHMSTSS